MERNETQWNEPPQFCEPQIVSCNLVILRCEDTDEWLDGDLRDVGRLEAMLAPYPAGATAATPADATDLRA
jgi:hypothetical protein